MAVDNPDAGNIVGPHVLEIYIYIYMHQSVTCSLIFNEEDTFDIIHGTSIVLTNWKHGFNLNIWNILSIPSGIITGSNNN